MPATYDREDMVLELKQELATAEDNLKAEFAAHGKTLERLHRTEERLSRIEAKIKAFADDIASEPEKTRSCSPFTASVTHDRKTSKRTVRNER